MILMLVNIDELLFELTNEDRMETLEALGSICNSIKVDCNNADVIPCKVSYDDDSINLNVDESTIPSDPNRASGFFFFKFDSRAGLEAVLEGGPWLIRKSLIILKKWLYTLRLLDAACRKVLNLLKKGLLKVEATLKSAWTEKDEIDNLLKERRLIRSLEKFVGGKLYEGDLRLRQKNHMILSYDVFINQFDESNANVLERFYTSAGNPVKEILLKLNLPDHKILKDGGEDFRYSDTERLSRSDEVLKLKNFKKDATLKLFKSTNQERLVPSCFVISDLEPFLFDFDFNFEIFKSFPCLSCCLCHLASLYLDQHAHTLHHLESLIIIDNLCLDNLDIFKEDLVYQSL
ncbi:hypothetical protein Tco_1300644 [Tanacetum coccineum]